MSGREKDSVSSGAQDQLELVPLDDDGRLTAEEQKSIMRRIDRRLLFSLAPLFCVSILDRGNIALAAIAGMRQDLELGVGARYSLVNLVFFLSYFFVDLPSTVILRWVGARPFLAGITLTWGLLLLGFGFMKNWGTLLALRALLGALEAGFIPGALYLMSTWYPRYEQGRRYAVLYLVAAVVVSLGGILAYGLTQMDGIANLRGWRWIFIVEGILTCLVAIYGYIFLIDFPDTQRPEWRFLSPAERAWVIRRVDADRGDAVALKFKLSMYLRTARDWRLWAYGLIYYTAATIAYSFAVSLPLILHESLGYSVSASQCLITPPHVFAALVVWAQGHVSDRLRLRGPLIVVNAVVCLVGLPILGWHPTPGVRYFGVFLVAAGTHGTLPLAVTYQANNVRGQWKRAMANAIMPLFAALGGITGATVFRSQDAATGYKPGYWACIGAAFLMLILPVILMLHFRRENAEADAGIKELECDENESQPGFRYTL